MISPPKKSKLLARKFVKNIHYCSSNREFRVESKTGTTKSATSSTPTWTIRDQYHGQTFRNYTETKTAENLFLVLFCSSLQTNCSVEKRITIKKFTTVITLNVGNWNRIKMRRQTKIEENIFVYRTNCFITVQIWLNETRLPELILYIVEMKYPHEIQFIRCN